MDSAQELICCQHNFSAGLAEICRELFHDLCNFLIAECNILVAAGEPHEEFLVLRLHQFLQQLFLLSREVICLRHLQMIFHRNPDVQDHGILLVLTTGDRLQPIGNLIHVPENLSQNIQLFFRQRRNLVRRRCICRCPHSIDRQHIPPVRHHSGAARVVHIQFIMRILHLDLFDAVCKLCIQHGHSLRHRISGAAVLTGKENSKRRRDQEPDQADD